MRLRNLKIQDLDIPNRIQIIDEIQELEQIIKDNYLNSCEREIAIEYNIGSRLGEPKEYLVVYVNPEYKNNPYVFILKQENNERFLVKETSLKTFEDVADPYVRQEVNKTIAIGFKRLPEHAFLSENQIQTARSYAYSFDLER